MGQSMAIEPPARGSVVVEALGVNVELYVDDGIFTASLVNLTPTQARQLAMHLELAAAEAEGRPVAEFGWTRNARATRLAAEL